VHNSLGVNIVESLNIFWFVLQITVGRSVEYLINSILDKFNGNLDVENFPKRDWQCEDWNI